MKPTLYIYCFFLLVACADTPSKTVASEKELAAKVVALKPTTTKDTILMDSIQSPKIDFSLDYIMGKFDPKTHDDFIELSTKHASSKEMYLRKDTYEAFKKMDEAARKDGIKFVIRSATRPFNHQKRIWEGKWTGARLVDGKDLSKSTPKVIPRALRILEYSSMPSTSRHHWGTDFDINAFENSYFETGEGKKIYDWMLQHAASFGFCQPYTPKGDGGRPHGYNEEKWHWSYQPISKILTQQAKTKLKDSDIGGFQGAETAVSIGVVEKYVLGINPECLE